jgi:AraC-like DNA-binding protein
MDPLSDVLRALRVTGSVLFQAEFGSPFAVTAPAACDLAPLLLPDADQMVLFHIIVDGDCWVELAGEVRTALATGDILIFPHGASHTLGAGDTAARDMITALLPPLPWHRLPDVRSGGQGAVTRVLCGFLHCDDLGFNPLLGHLPDLIVVGAEDAPPGALLSPLIAAMLAETSSEQPGSDCLGDRFAELLFVHALRAHMTRLSTADTGWLAALSDPGIAQVLSLLHGDPARAWTVDELARRVAMSRSVLAERFKRLLDMGPMQYLTRWRLLLGAQRLRDSQESIAAIGAAVGYESEAAFSRAFKRVVGTAPGAWRSSRRGGAGR